MSNATGPGADAAQASTRAARRTALLSLACVFLVAVVVRWITVPSLQGDDHWALLTAATFLQGDRPFRDFADLGDPLYWAMSALMQVVTGYRVIGEVALGTLLTAVTIVIAFNLTKQATQSTRLAWTLSVLALLVTCERELYSHPKLFLYPLVLWLSWRYIDRPTLARSAWLACGVAVAFGYRHDHGAYTGTGAAAAILAAHWAAGPRQIATAAIRLGAVLLLLVAPYLLLVQAHEGVVAYFQERLRLAGRMDDGSRQPVRLRADESAPAALVSVAPPAPARVFVEWQPDVDAEARTALERRYSLERGSHAKNGLFDYTLEDVSPQTIGALRHDVWIVEHRGLPVSPDVLPAADAPVQIRWDPRVDDVERRALERRYHLAADRNNAWEYALTAADRANIEALVNDPAVYDTGLIDRDRFTPAEESWFDDLQRVVPLLRVSVAPRYWHVANAGVVLHHLFMALPYMLLALLVIDVARGRVAAFMPHARAKMFASAVMTAVTFGALLRREGYFADHTALAVVLGACAVAWVRERCRDVQLGALNRGILRATATAALVVFAGASLTFAQGTMSLPAVKANVLEFWPRSVRRFREFSVSPPIDAYAPRGVSGDARVLRYLYDCTAPDDRVWVASDLFRFPYYLQRRIVGHIYWDAGLLHDEEHQKRTLATLERDRVPYIVSYGLQSPMKFLETYPLVLEYVSSRYTGRFEIIDEKSSELKFFILTDGRLTPVRTDPTFGLPCFR